ncbi:ThiJ/PfpI [Lasiodiplodia theobromae]|nr:ThiJ/PfpI [Lasiodiplodia theobromae]
MTIATPLEIGVLLVGEEVQFNDIAPADLLYMISPEFLVSLGPAVPPMQSLAVPMNISYINEKGEGLFPLTAGAKIVVTHSLTTAPKLDIMIIPGTSADPTTRPAIDRFIKSAVAGGTAVLSICSGIFPTAASGILDGLVATAPLGVLSLVRERFPNVKWVSKCRWEKCGGAGGQGEIWTSGAVANGVDLTCEFMRQKFPESRQLVDFMIALSGIAERRREYSMKEKIVEAMVEGERSPAQ